MSVRVRLLCLLLLVPGALHTRPARAQEPDTTLVLPDVTVTATRTPTPTASAPARVTVLDADAVAQTGARSVADLLGARSTAFVRAYGGGGAATLSLRGSTPEQTLVLLDGQRITDPQLGQLDLSLLPTLLLHSVEVMHGAGSPLYGTDGMGGVVNLRTHAPTAGRHLRFSGAYGAFGERSGGLMVAGGRARHAGLALVEYAETDGDYPYRSPAFFPPRDVRREGADRQRLSLYGATTYRTVRSRLRLSGWYNDAERGLPTIGSVAARGERQWDESLRLWADGETRYTWGTLRLGGLVQHAALRYVNDLLDVDDTGRTRMASLEVEVQTHRLARWLLAGGLQAGRASARHPSLEGGAAETHASAFAHGTGAFGALLLYPALRTDLYTRPGGAPLVAVSPRLGLNVRPFETRPLHAKASVGRSFRAPTFNERFWQPGGRPDLRPERGWTYDAGLFYRGARSRGEVTIFAAHTRDQIVWLPATTTVWTPDNVRRSRARGLELSYEWQQRWSRHTLGGGIQYTVTDTRDRSDPASAAYDQPLRYVPREQLKLFVTAGVGPVSLDVNGRYTGRRYVTTDGSEHLDPYVVLDAQLRLAARAAGLQLQLALLVENALDARYAVLQNYPMPPRHARLRLLVMNNEQ